MKNKSLLGKKVMDTVTGVTGVAIQRCEYMNGCIQYAIQPKVIVDGVPVKALWYDEEQVNIVPKEKKIRPKAKPTGGPAPTNPPARNRNMT